MRCVYTSQIQRLPFPRDTGPSPRHLVPVLMLWVPWNLTKTKAHRENITEERCTWFSLVINNFLSVRNKQSKQTSILTNIWTTSVGDLPATLIVFTSWTSSPLWIKPASTKTDIMIKHIRCLYCAFAPSKTTNDDLPMLTYTKIGRYSEIKSINKALTASISCSS